jgi:hypothetical protein
VSSLVDGVEEHGMLPRKGFYKPGMRTFPHSGDEECGFDPVSCGCCQYNQLYKSEYISEPCSLDVVLWNMAMRRVDCNENYCAEEIRWIFRCLDMYNICTKFLLNLKGLQ